MIRKVGDSTHGVSGGNLRMAVYVSHVIVSAGETGNC
jgi:hypothetical protein